MLRSACRLIAVALLLLAGSTALAGALLQPIDAPEWEVSTWINADPGKMADHRGRVVMIQFFQLWCPASNEYAIPTFQAWAQRYDSRDDVLLVGIHSVFEGHQVQDETALRQYVELQGLRFPVGSDAYTKDDPVTPVTMKRYDVEGTPQLVIVDKTGQVRFSHLGKFERPVVEAFVERLLKEPGPKPGTAKPTAGPVRDEALSGRYIVTVGQTAKTCGKLIPAMTVEADVSVLTEQVKARFTRGFLGMNDVSAKYDAATGRFEGRTRRRTSEGGVPVNVTLDIRGTISRDDGPPRFEYEFTMEKESEQADLACRVEGRGKGTRQ